MPLLITATWLI